VLNNREREREIEKTNEQTGFCHQLGPGQSLWANTFFHSVPEYCLLSELLELLGEGWQRA
jgi:hypothetical protein